jgi:hypothetical protein
MGPDSLFQQAGKSRLPSSSQLGAEKVDEPKDIYHTSYFKGYISYFLVVTFPDMPVMQPLTPIKEIPYHQQMP